MRYQFYLDGILVENPIGWDRQVVSFRYDRTLSARLVTQDGNFDFVGSGYQYLAGKVDTDWNSDTLLEIYEDEAGDGSMVLSSRGYIMTPSIELDRQKFRAKVKVQDDSFYARIRSNMNLKVLPFSTLSKNNETIVACPIVTVEYTSRTSGIQYTIAAGS